MNFTKHKDYLIAVGVSLTFHLLLLILLGFPASKNPGLETFPVGLVEISSGSPMGVMVSLPKNESVAFNGRGSRQSHKGNTVFKSNMNLNQPQKDTIVLSKKEGIISPDNSVKKQVNQSASSENADSDNPVKKPVNQSASSENAGSDNPVKKQVNQSASSENADSDNPVKKQVNQSASGENAGSDNPVKKQVNQSASSENTNSDDSVEKPIDQNSSSGNTEEITGSENPETGKPEDFGTGEALVTVLGPMPPYPQNAMNEGKHGDVAIRILVNADGSMELAIVTNSSGDARLDYAATSSIERAWKFKSVTKDYYINLVFSFSIQTGVTVKFLDSETRP